MRVLQVVAMVVVPALLVAQAPARPAAPATSATPRGMRAIREADLRRDLFAMAAPEMRGREGGTIDEMRAPMTTPP